jgi:glutaminyl-peptide cyclotransferase
VPPPPVITNSQPAPPPPDTKRPKFDSKIAFDLLVKQCDFGPRPVGSEAHAKLRDYLIAEMKKYADKTVAQDFTYKGMPLTNVIGVFNPEAKRQVLLCGHWDTRPTADMELDPAKKKKPILGASDGASEIAVLLELARNFKEQKPDVGVIIVLLDGEDYGDFEKNQGVFLGAQYFAKNHEGYHPEYGILIDMVGDKNLDIYREVNSQNYAPGTNNKVFRIARELGFGKNIIDDLKTNVSDDHFALNQAHIPTIDLIDFNYEFWHTLEDTPDKCSAESLGIVGNLLAEVIYREKAK